MTILVTGSTGVIGSQVVANLAEKGAEVHALTRSPEKTKFPRGVTLVKGDLMDIDATQAAIAKTSTLFLLTPSPPTRLPRRCSRSVSPKRPASSASSTSRCSTVTSSPTFRISPANTRSSA